MKINLNDGWFLKYKDLEWDKDEKVETDPGKNLNQLHSGYNGEMVDGKTYFRKAYADSAEAEIWAARILSEQEGWISAGDLPCDVHVPLIENGIIKEPLIGLNSFDNVWIEKKSWWFKKIFKIGDELSGYDAVELVIESLDIGAEIFINGKHIGTHISAFYQSVNKDQRNTFISYPVDPSGIHTLYIAALQWV